MNTLACFAFFAAGIAVDATYNYIRKRGENRAWHTGYGRAKREESIRKEMREKYEGNYNFPSYDIVPKKENKINKVPESFMDELHTNGRAVIRLNNGGVEK